LVIPMAFDPDRGGDQCADQRVIPQTSIGDLIGGSNPPIFL
jgi:hypothetical protein